MVMLLLLVSLAAASGALHALAAAAAQQLGAVTVAGARRLTDADVVRLSALTAGQPIAPADLDAVVRRMAATGLLASVRYRYTTAGDRLDVAFEIEEPAWTMPVVLDNFVWMRDDELAAAVRQKVPTFDGALPENEQVTVYMTGALQQVLDERGIRGRVEFILHRNLAAGRSQFVFSVREAGLSVCALRVPGAAAIPERELVEAAAGLMGRDYSRMFLTEFADSTLGTMYRRKGFWRAAFRAPAATVGAPPEACASVSVALPVDEGVAYAWDRANWSGVSVLTTKELDRLLGLRAGDVADVTKIEAGLRSVESAYRQRGFMLQRASTRPAPDDASRRLTLAVPIDEGPQFRMGELIVAGLSERDAASLRKRWRLAAGDVYDDAYARRFRSENGSPARRPSLELALDRDRGVVHVRITATPRGRG